MSHEHHGDCCGQAEQRMIEQAHFAAEHLGNLCVSGMCAHPGHQPGLAFDQQRLYQEQMSETLTETNSSMSTRKKEKKKRKYGLFVGLLATATAN
jgi:hypothetical protein